MMGPSLGLLGVLVILGIAAIMIYAMWSISRRGGSARAVMAVVLCLLFLVVMGGLFLAGSRGPARVNSHGVSDEALDAVLMSEWSGQTAGAFANYPSFQSAVNGVLGHVLQRARRCGVQERYVQNVVVAGLPKERLAPQSWASTRQFILNRDQSRLSLAQDLDDSAPDDRFEVSFDVEGDRDKGSIRVSADAKARGESVGGNKALPLTVLVEYGNQPWAERAGSAPRDDDSHVIGCSQQFSQLEKARNNARVNARHRFVDLTFAAVQASRPALKPEEATRIKTRAEMYLDGHAELQQDEFVQRTQGPSGTKYRVAVLMDFPREDLLSMIGIPEKARADPWVSQVIAGVGLALLLVLAYLFLDAGSRGRYAWPLRIGSVALFGGLCLVLWRITGELRIANGE